MICLSFDTSAKVASVAVLEDKKTLASYSVDNGLTQSELILPMAEDIMKKLGLSYSDIELLATSVGPGSFTGVRIGVSLVKGLSFGKGIPCVGVSTLEALAENLRGLPGVIVPVMDARRNQVYTATFSSDGEELKRETVDRAISLDELAEELKSASGSIYLVGDGYEVAKKALGSLGVKIINTPVELRNENAASVGRVALGKYERGEYVSDLEIAPIYLRMPQAERERLERLGNTK